MCLKYKVTYSASLTCTFFAILSCFVLLCFHSNLIFRAFSASPVVSTPAFRQTEPRDFNITQRVYCMPWRVSTDCSFIPLEILELLPIDRKTFIDSRLGASEILAVHGV